MLLHPSEANGNRRDPDRSSGLHAGTALENRFSHSRDHTGVTFVRRRA